MIQFPIFIINNNEDREKYTHCAGLWTTKCYNFATDFSATSKYFFACNDILLYSTTDPYHPILLSHHHVPTWDIWVNLHFCLIWGQFCNWFAFLGSLYQRLMYCTMSEHLHCVDTFVQVLLLLVLRAIKLLLHWPTFVTKKKEKMNKIEALTFVILCTSNSNTWL